MFEVDVKNVTEEGRGPARVWGSDVDFEKVKFQPAKWQFVSNKNISPIF